MKVSAKNVMKQKSYHKGTEHRPRRSYSALATNYQTGEYMLVPLVNCSLKSSGTGWKMSTMQKWS